MSIFGEAKKLTTRKRFFYSLRPELRTAIAAGPDLRMEPVFSGFGWFLMAWMGVEGDSAALERF